MTRDDLLEQALFSSATIHQPHALKAYWCANSLFAKLNGKEQIWEQTSKLISRSELRVNCIYSKTVEAPEFSDQRIKSVLNRSVFPAAYPAMLQWHHRSGFVDIFEHYLEEASKTDEYLSHKVTILLAMNLVHEELKPEQIPVFIDRFVEFITSTDDPNVTSFEAVTIADVLKACISKIGFFGHNVITLAWILRSRNYLSKDQLDSMLSNLYRQATGPFEDPDDEVNKGIWDQCEKNDSQRSFIGKIDQLVFGYCSNLHQVTLADALCYLQEAFPEHTADFSCIADYQCRVLAE